MRTRPSASWRPSRIPTLLLLALAVVTCHMAADALLRAATARAAAPPGSILWHQVLSPSTVTDEWRKAAIGPDGSLYVAGIRQNDGPTGKIMVGRYGPDAAELWSAWWGPGTLAEVGDIAVDGKGNLYLVGTADESAVDSDMVVLKYSHQGALLWEIRIGSVGSSRDAGRDVALDAAGNVYACGSQENPGSGMDLMVVKLTPNGDQRYKTFHRTSGLDSADFICVDATGSAYVLGQSVGSDLLADVVLMRLSPQGAKRWVRRIDTPVDSNKWVEGLALGSDSVQLVARLTGVSTWDTLVARYRLNGTRRWVRKWDTGPQNTETPGGIGVDAAGSVYVSASVSGPPGAGPSRGALVKWDAAGKLRWTHWVTHPVLTAGAGLGALAVTPAGTSFGAGYFETGTALVSMFVARFSAGGKLVWLQPWDGPHHLGGSARALVYGRSLSGLSYLYCAGYHMPAAWPDLDAVVLRLQP